MGDFLKELNSKPDRTTTVDYDKFVKSRQKLRFESDYEPQGSNSSNTLSSLDQFNVGRRRSKSQGHLNGNQTNVVDYDYHLNFEDDDVDFHRNNSLDYGLQGLAMAPEASIRRKVASSFHVFEDENENLFSRPLSPEFSKQGSELGFDFEPVVGSSNSLLDQLRATARDRAESDMGLYSSLRNRLQSEAADERPVSKLRQPTSGVSNMGRGSALKTSRSPTENLAPRAIPSNNETNENVNGQETENKNYDQSYKEDGINGKGNGYKSSVGNGKHYSGPQSQRPPAGSGKNDWTCLACGNTNYSWRHVCNMRKCRAPKPGHLQDPPPSGSWACPACGNLNYPERMVCNMRKCRSPRPLNPSMMSQIQPQPTFMQYNPSQQLPPGFNQYDPTRQNMMGMQLGYTHPQPSPMNATNYYGGLSPKMQYFNSVNTSVQNLSQQMAESFSMQEQSNQERQN